MTASMMASLSGRTMQRAGSASNPRPILGFRWTSRAFAHLMNRTPIRDMPGEPNSTIMVVSCGSSSLKFSVLRLPAGEELARGLFQRLGGKDATLSITCGEKESQDPLPDVDHDQALGIVIERLEEALEARLRLDGLGHRVVHGGEKFSTSVLIDDQVVEEIRSLADLAPLHNQANATGIEVARKRFREIPHVAVFDTAFHHAMPPRAFHYALPQRRCRSEPPRLPRRDRRDVPRRNHPDAEQGERPPRALRDRKRHAQFARGARSGQHLRCARDRGVLLSARQSSSGPLRRIATESSPLVAFVIPTNEELRIAQETQQLL